MVIKLSLAGAALLGLTVPALAVVPAPVCRQHDVLDYAAQKIAAQQTYAKLQRRSVVETPTYAPNTVMCTGYVKITHYDAAGPIINYEVRRFTVKRLDAGFEVAIQ